MPNHVTDYNTLGCRLLLAIYSQQRFTPSWGFTISGRQPDLLFHNSNVIVHSCIFHERHFYV